MLRRTVALAALLIGSASVGAATPAQAASSVQQCTTAGNVWVVVNSKVNGKDSYTQGCAISPATGLDALRQVTSATTANGFISKIGGKPEAANPDPYVYWNYFHRQPAGGGSFSGWEYASLGAGSYAPKPGSIEGWAYGASGVSVNWTPPAPTTAASPATTAAGTTTAPPAATAAQGAPATTTRAGSPTTAAATRTTTRPTTATTTAAPDVVPATTVISASSAAAETPEAAPATIDPSPTRSSAAATEGATSSGSPTVTPQASAAPMADDRGTPMAAIATLGFVVAMAGGGAWWSLKRRP